MLYPLLRTNIMLNVGGSITCITDTLPKTISGKIRRNELRERELQRARSQAKSG